MKPGRMILGVVLSALVVYLLVREGVSSDLSALDAGSVLSEEELFEAGVATPPIVDSVVSSSAVQIVSAPVETEVEEQTPVQPLEERGDAMLSEIDALGGVPFDQAVTMPFD